MQNLLSIDLDKAKLNKLLIALEAKEKTMNHKTPLKEWFNIRNKIRLIKGRLNGIHD